MVDQLELKPYTLSEAKKAMKVKLYEKWTEEIGQCDLKRLQPIVLNGRIAPVIREFMLNFFTAQLLSGHGSFNSFLHKIKRSDTDQCPFGDGRETPEHILTECSGNNSFRLSLGLTNSDLELANWPFADPSTATKIAMFVELAFKSRNIVSNVFECRQE